MSDNDAVHILKLKDEYRVQVVDRNIIAKIFRNIQTNILIFEAELFEKFKEGKFFPISSKNAAVVYASNLEEEVVNYSYRSCGIFTITYNKTYEEIFKTYNNEENKTSKGPLSVEIGQHWLFKIRKSADNPSLFEGSILKLDGDIITLKILDLDINIPPLKKMFLIEDLLFVKKLTNK